MLDLSHVLKVTEARLVLGGGATPGVVFVSSVAFQLTLYSKVNKVKGVGREFIAQLETQVVILHNGDF